MKEYPFYTAVGAEQERLRKRRIGYWIVAAWGALGLLAFTSGLLRHMHRGDPPSGKVTAAHRAP